MGGNGPGEVRNKARAGQAQKAGQGRSKSRAGLRAQLCQRERTTQGGGLHPVCQTAHSEGMLFCMCCVLTHCFAAAHALGLHALDGKGECEARDLQGGVQGKGEV